MPHHIRPHRGGVRFGGPPRMIRPDFNNENTHEPNERFQKRSRWGDFDNSDREGGQQQENASALEDAANDNKGGSNTPLHDEPFNREFAEIPAAAIQSNESQSEAVHEEAVPAVDEKQGGGGGENDTAVTD